MEPRVHPTEQILILIDFRCFNATFNTISATSWEPVLVTEEAEENHRPCRGSKLKKMCISRTRPTVRKRCDSKYFLGDLRQLFFFVTGSSNIVPEFTFGTSLHF